MSLINEMLKDLEKRRSRDLETSASLSQNITWETRPEDKTFNWLIFFIVFIVFFLASVIGYLLWERSSSLPTVSAADQMPVEVRKEIKKQPANANKTIVKKSHVKKKREAVKSVEPIIEFEASVDETVDVDELENSEPIKLKKIRRPLNNKQLAETAYKKGYQFLQQGRMRQGKEQLREALSLYIPHIKAREMLAGIHIKAGRFINAAELLSEGVKVAPEYPLFAKLYARVLLEQNNPKLAVTILEQGTVSARMDVEPDYYALLAATYQRTKNHKRAIEIYLQLVKIRSAVGVWWLGLAISLEKSGEAKAAVEAYQRAQSTGSLKAGLVKFTNNRVTALKEIGFPEE